jgi:nucleoid DNA-binding protein
MTEDDIINRLVLECNLNRIEAKDLVEAFLSDIKNRVSSGERVKLSGLGTFFLKTQDYQRKRRDIPVDEDTPPWRTVSFKPSPAIQARVQRALIEEKRIETKDRIAAAEFLSQQEAFAS